MYICCHVVTVQSFPANMLYVWWCVLMYTLLLLGSAVQQNVYYVRCYIVMYKKKYVVTMDRFPANMWYVWWCDDVCLVYIYGVIRYRFPADVYVVWWIVLMYMMSQWRVFHQVCITPDDVYWCLCVVRAYHGSLSSKYVIRQITCVLGMGIVNCNSSYLQNYCI